MTRFRKCITMVVFCIYPRAVSKRPARTAMLVALFCSKSKSNYYYNQIHEPISRDLNIWGDFKSLDQKSFHNMNMPHPSGLFQLGVVAKHAKACSRHLSLASRLRSRGSTVMLRVDTRLESLNRTAPTAQLRQRPGPARQAFQLIEITDPTNDKVPDGCQILRTDRRDKTPTRIRL